MIKTGVWEKTLILVYRSRGADIHYRGGSMAASGRHSSPSRKLGDHITFSSRKQRKQARHKAGLPTPKAHPETHVFQQGCIV